MKILYVKHNSERSKSYQIRTIIFEESGIKYVKKQAMCREAIPHLKKMKENYESLLNSIINPRVKLAKILKETEDSLVFEFIEGVSLDSKLDDALDISENLTKNVFEEYKTILFNSFKTEVFNSETMVNNELIDTFGDIDYSRFDGQKCFATVSNVDLILSNIILQDEDIYIIDYEWMYNISLPIEFVIFRTSSIKNIKFLEDNEFNLIYRMMDNYFIKKLVADESSFFFYNEKYKKTATSLDDFAKRVDVQKERIALMEGSIGWRALKFVRKGIFFLKKYLVKVKKSYSYILRQREQKKDIASDTNGKIKEHIQNSEKKYDKLCIFSHFDKDGIVDEYVFSYISSLNNMGVDIVFVSTANTIAPKYLNRLKRYCRDIVCKENIGYDFGAWATGFNLLEKEIENYEQVIICNDSVYAPLFDLGEMFSAMNDKNIDFWGITDSHEIQLHIQSYFICFNKNIVKNEQFRKFWKNYKVYKVKRNIIENYEVKLTSILESKGFSFDVYCPSNELSDSKEPLNSTHSLWDKLIEQRRCPIIKIELLRDNPLGLDISNWSGILNTKTRYNTSLIDNHLKRIKSN